MKDARNVKERRMFNKHFPDKWSDGSREHAMKMIRKQGVPLCFHRIIQQNGLFHHILDIFVLFHFFFFFLLSLNLLFCLFVNPEKRKWKLVEKVSQQRTEHVTVRKRASSHSNPFSCYGVNNFELKKVFIIKKRFNFVLYTHYSYSYTLLYIAFIFLKKSKYYYSFLITRERWDPPL